MTKYKSEKYIEYSPKHHFNTQIVDTMLNEISESSDIISQHIFELDEKYRELSKRTLQGPPKPGFLNNFRMERMQKNEANSGGLPREYKVADLTTNFIPSWLNILNCSFSPFFSGFLNRESYLIMKEFTNKPIDHNSDIEKPNEYFKKNSEEDLYISFVRDFSQNVFSVLPKSSNCNLIIGLRRQGESVPYKRLPVLTGSVNSVLLDKRCQIIDIIGYANNPAGFGFSIKNMYIAEFSSPSFNIDLVAKTSGLYKFFAGITPEGNFVYNLNTNADQRSNNGTSIIQMEVGDHIKILIPSNAVLHYFGYNLY
jgi:hypothetical protein